MPNKSAKYYMGKVATVVKWLKNGKNAELRDCGKISGRCAEIVQAQVETLNEVQHFVSDIDTLNAYFSFAVKNEPPKEKCPNFFRQLEDANRSDSLGPVKDILAQLISLRDEVKISDSEDGILLHVENGERVAVYLTALNKAIRFMEITEKFLSPKEASRSILSEYAARRATPHAQMINDRIEGD